MSDFYGLPTRSLDNGRLRLEFLAAAGPRIVRLFLNGRPGNLLAETPDLAWETPYGVYYLRGGHRLWHAPESAGRSSIPDNEGLIVEELAGGVRLSQPVEVGTGIQKTLDIQLRPGRAVVSLHHYLRNDGLWPVHLAPWAITQLPPEGLVILPQQVGPLDPDGLRPNRHLVFWPYTRTADSRLCWDDDYLFIRAQALTAPLKIGYLNRHGWLGYLWQDVFFKKRFTPLPGQVHPDWDCNTEVYANHRYVELETLGPLRCLEPGETVHHTEEWEVWGGVETPRTLGEVGALIKSVF